MKEIKVVEDQLDTEECIEVTGGGIIGAIVGKTQRVVDDAVGSVESIARGLFLP